RKVCKDAFPCCGVGCNRLNKEPLVRIVLTDVLPLHRGVPSKHTTFTLNNELNGHNDYGLGVARPSTRGLMQDVASGSFFGGPALLGANHRSVRHREAVQGHPTNLLRAGASR